MTTDGATVGYLGVSRSLSGRAWRLRPAADSDVRGLQQATGLSEPLARALASRGIRRDQLPLGGAHRRIDGIAGTQRLAATLARPVTRRQGIVARNGRLHGSLVRRQQPVANRESTRLIELDLLGHVMSP